MFVRDLKSNLGGIGFAFDNGLLDGILDNSIHNPFKLSKQC